MQRYNWTSNGRFMRLLRNDSKIFHEYVNQSTTEQVKEGLQKLEDKINMLASQKGVLVQ